MLNANKYDKLVSNYISKTAEIYDEGHREYDKWKAVAHCRLQWNPDATDFGEMFWNAFSMSGTMIETNERKPITGIVRLCADSEKSEIVRSAFTGLLREANPAERKISLHINHFLEIVNAELEGLSDPAYLLQAQDVVMFLGFIEPEKYILFRPELVKAFADRLDPELSFGIENLSVSQCYTICNELQVAIRKDMVLTTTLDRMLALQEERDERVTGMYTKMPGKMNIMVYELMYTAAIYNLYNGIRKTMPRKAPEHKLTAAELKKEHYVGEQNRLQELKDRYTNELEQLSYPSLDGLKVCSKTYGEGRVTASSGAIITIDFNGTVKRFAFPDCFTNGFITTSDLRVMQACDREVTLRAKIKKLEGNISTVKIIISKLDA